MSDETAARDWDHWRDCLEFLGSLMEAQEIAEMSGLNRDTVGAHLSGDTTPAAAARRGYVYAARRLRGQLQGVEAAGYYSELPTPAVAAPRPIVAGDGIPPAGDEEEDDDEPGLPTPEARDRIKERLEAARRERKAKYND